MHRRKSQIDGLHPTLGTFDGFQQIRLLPFLGTFKEALDALGKSEGIAVRVIAYFLNDDVKDAYEAQVNPGTAASELAAFWLYVIHSLLKRFLVDDILREAMETVTTAKQNPGEDETQFASRVLDASRACRHLFRPVELVNAYLQGLYASTRARVQEHVRNLPSHERANIVRVRQLALAEGTSQRDFFSEQKASSSKFSTTLHHGAGPPQQQPTSQATHLIHAPDPGASQPLLLPSTPTRSVSTDSRSDVTNLPPQAPTPTYRPDFDPASVVLAVAQLENILNGNASSLSEVLVPIRSKGATSFRTLGPHPEQIEEAMAAISSDYWTLECWSCHEKGHSTFTCPSLSSDHRLFFAYCYYLNQVSQHPMLKEWHNQKRDALHGEGAGPGPRPSKLSRGRGDFARGRGGRQGFEGAGPSDEHDEDVVDIGPDASTPASSETE